MSMDVEKSFTPRETVSELDRFIVGQARAKRAVAVALRNRWRRKRVPPPLRDEIAPKNILLMGPTGCGKTEIARRLAKLADAPFVKVEATKFTEVGYVGRDVDSMVRDLVEVSIKLVREEAMAHVRIRAHDLAEERVLDLLLPRPEPRRAAGFPGLPFDARESSAPSAASSSSSSSSTSSSSTSSSSTSSSSSTDDRTRERFRQMLREGQLVDREVELEVTASQPMPLMQMFGQPGMEEMASGLQDALSSALGGAKKKRRKLRVPDALEALAAEEAAKLIDADQIQKDAIQRAEQAGIIFIDEIDKIAGASRGQGPDVSREGVQRDILPIIEGSTVNTKYGPVRTDHVLFICAGAFHMSKPSDLIPELQGRLPIRVELEPLSESDFVRILSEPENSLVRQYTALLETEGVSLTFETSGLAAIARVACRVNQEQENIGARRLYTILERLVEEISFDAPDKRGTSFVLDEAFVTGHLSPILQSEDLSKYIL